MSTKNFRKLIKGTVEYVLKNSSNNYILIGENTSGKSELLFSIMRRMIENSKIDQIYFIDSVNRSFHLDAISSFQKEKKEYDYREICAMRLEERTFNKMDSFGPARIESIYWMYEDKLKALVEDFFGLQIDIKISEQENTPINIPARLEIIKGDYVFTEDHENLNMPNGMQAVFRIFLELLFLKDNVNKITDTDEKNIVCIEELDLYLSEKYSAEIFNFIRKAFPNFVFIVSTHSRALTVTAKETNVIAIKGTEKWIVNSGENYELDVEELFADIFYTEETLMHTNDDRIDRKLRVLLNNKITGDWCEMDSKMFKEINTEELKPHQVFLREEIERWDCE